jgi:S1-C subfamily serine protease
VGFAIPIDTVKGLVDQVLQFGKIVRPVLGISIAPPQTLRQLQLEGVLVLEVQPGSPAEKAGMKGTLRFFLLLSFPSRALIFPSSYFFPFELSIFSPHGFFPFLPSEDFSPFKI